MKLLYILLTFSEACNTNNHSTYIIPDAQLCIPNFSNKMDGYFFGPCNNTKNLECEEILLKCRFAKFRNKYCFIQDSHFCSFQNRGKYINFYQVECG